MALSRTNLLGEISPEAVGTGTYVSASFTPPDNSLLVVAVGMMEAAGTTDPSGDMTVAGGGLTFTSQAVIGHTTSWTLGARIWTAPVTTGASMTLTLDCAARNAYWYGIAAVAYTGYNTGTPVGATGTLIDVTTPDGAQSLTLSGAPATSSEVFALLTMDKESAGTTPGAAFTELYDMQVAGSSAGGVEAEIRTGSTSTTVDWVDCHTGSGSIFTLLGAAIEVNAAAGVSSDAYQWTPRQFAAPVPRLFRTGVLAPLQLMGDRTSPVSAVDATVAATAVVTTTGLTAPTIQTGSTVAAIATVTTVALPVPSFQTGSVVSAIAVATATALPAPTIGTQTLVFPATIVTTTTLTAPAIQTGSTVAATAVATTTALPAPTLPTELRPVTVATTTALPAPAVQTGSRVAATAIAMAVALAVPTIDTGTALVREDLLTETSGPPHGTGTFTTGGFTPPNNSLLVVGGMAIEDGDTSPSEYIGDDLAITDSATLTWTQRVKQSGDDAGLGDYTTGVSIWTAPVTTGVSMTVTLSTGANAGIYAISIVAYTGYNIATPVGTTGENNQGYAPASTPTAASLTLTSPPAASSEVYAAVGVNHSIAGVTHGTGWTEIHDSTGTAWGGIQSQVRGTSTSAAVDWDALNPTGNLYNYAAVAVEIRSAAIGADATIGPTAIATTASLPAPSFQTGSVVAALTVTTLTDVPVVVVSASGSADANQSGIHIPWMFVLPTEASFQLQGTATTPANPNATVQPPSIATVTAVDAPAVQTGSTIAATSLATVTALPVPSFQTGSIVSATHIATVTAMPAPVISAGGGVTLPATAVATVTALPAPAVQTGQRVNPATIATVTAITAPTISTFTDATVAATALATVTALPAPTVSASTEITATSIATVTALPLATVVGNVFSGIPGHGRPRGSGGATGNAYPRTSGGIIGRAG